ncbi:DUF2938 domain-containing protein [Enterovibrio calviensis]|uniref:DUF2938 domain-containing protein n=1 Tax=Enterovibrio calviensis TaxID=91359 RepID=UPI00048697A7|nr:DUF2938 domain-containing protein [Enterovibrio calviensis]
MNSETLNFIVTSVVIGVGATLVMDIWALTLRKFLGIMPLNYGLVGRWAVHMGKGTFRHENISKAKPVRAELLIGWTLHYLTGVIFAATLIMVLDNSWITTPSVFPAICFGALTVGLPFFVMQPAMGLGIAASKTPKPSVARFRSVITHIIFGFGLYLSASMIGPHLS